MAPAEFLASSQPQGPMCEWVTLPVALASSLWVGASWCQVEQDEGNPLQAGQHCRLMRKTRLGWIVTQRQALENLQSKPRISYPIIYPIYLQHHSIITKLSRCSLSFVSATPLWLCPNFWDRPLTGWDPRRSRPGLWIWSLIWKPSKSCSIGILWRLPHIDTAYGGFSH